MSALAPLRSPEVRADPPERLTVAICPFDTAYDYELAKLPHDIVLVGNTHRSWDKTVRPLPSNIRLAYSLRDLRADILIIGVDQWTQQEIDKRALFLRLRDAFEGPKIIVNHGCNMVDGCSSEEMRTLVGNNIMVCHTEAARDLWSVERSRVIRRGMTTSDWPQTDCGRGNIVVWEPGPYWEFYNTPAARHLVERLNRKVTWLGSDRTFTSFDAYRAFFASSAIFFNPSYAAPNPRAMIEALLCGLAVVTTASHGESAYITNGENGFASNNMSELYRYIEFLWRHPKDAQRIGVNGRRMAQGIFNSDKFIADWNSLVLEAVHGGVSNQIA